MKRFIILLLILPFAIISQAQKKVAVMDPTIEEGSKVTATEKAMLRGELRKAIIRVDGYEALSRADVDRVINELDFQSSGYVSEGEAHQLGELCGADYLCISSISKSAKQYYIEAYFVDVTTGKMLNPASQFGSLEDGTISDLYLVCQELIKELIGSSHTDKRPIIEDFESGETAWGWTIFSHDSRSAQVANGQLRLANLTFTGTTQSIATLPIDVDKDFKIHFNFVIKKAEMFSSVGVKFAGNNSITVNSGTCSYQVGDKKSVTDDVKMGLGQNRPVAIDIVKQQGNVTLFVNGIQVVSNPSPYTTSQVTVFAGSNTLAMLLDVTINYL